MTIIILAFILVVILHKDSVIGRYLLYDTQQNTQQNTKLPNFRLVAYSACTIMTANITIPIILNIPQITDTVLASSIAILTTLPILQTLDLQLCSTKRNPKARIVGYTALNLVNTPLALFTIYSVSPTYAEILYITAIIYINALVLVFAWVIARFHQTPTNVSHINLYKTTNLETITITGFTIVVLNIILLCFDQKNLFPGINILLMFICILDLLSNETSLEEQFFNRNQSWLGQMKHLVRQAIHYIKYLAVPMKEILTPRISGGDEDQPPPN